MANIGVAQGAQQVQKATVSRGGGARLHDGGVVQGRVLSAQGAGSYIVSVAGRQVAVRSSVPLAPGQAFTAQIQLRGREVALVLQGGAAEAPGAGGVQALLSALGLPETAESARLLAFAQELGIKLKPEQLKKALALAKGFADGEGAAEFSVLLDDKGLASGADAVQAVLDGGAGGYGRGGSNARHSEGQHGEARHGDERGGQDTPGGAERAPCAAAEDAARAILAAPAAFFAEYAKSADKAAATAAPGALTAANQLFRRRPPEDASLHWIQLPFEWERPGGHKAAGSAVSSGVIRVLWDGSRKAIRKISVKMNDGVAKKAFIVYYNSAGADRIAFCFEPPLPESRRRDAAKLLSETLFACTGRHIPARYGET